MTDKLQFMFLQLFAQFTLRRIQKHQKWLTEALLSIHQVLHRELQKPALLYENVEDLKNQSLKQLLGHKVPRKLTSKPMK